MSLALFDLNGKVAMVTGSTRGLGEVAAMALAKAGADVAICGRNKDDLKRVSAAVTELGKAAEGVYLDVTSTDSVQAGVDHILEHFAGI
jgi:NAD(P)-dependent dehydrogenase (short-subunit alcohol dehydrogenase family)